MRRVFIAVKIHAGESLRKLIATLKNDLADENIKWIDPDNIHVTLAFLGETEEEKIDDVKRLLRESCSGYGKFEFFLEGIGIFKSVINPRIIWVGTRASDELTNLNSTVNEGLKNIGFTIDERLFRPHVTIGRVKILKSTGQINALLEKYKASEIQKVPVDEVVLYESILGGPGAVYKPVFTVQL